MGVGVLVSDEVFVLLSFFQVEASGAAGDLAVPQALSAKPRQIIEVIEVLEKNRVKTPWRHRLHRYYFQQSGLQSFFIFEFYEEIHRKDRES